MNVQVLIDQFLFSELARFFEQRGELHLGQKIDARVIELKSDGRALIDFGGRFRALAEIPFPVKAGELLQLQLTQKGEVLKFTIVENKQQVEISQLLIKNQQLLLVIDSLIKKVESSFLPLTREFPEINQIFNNLKNFFANLQAFSAQKELSTTKIAALIKKVVENSGIMLESRLLKAVIQEEKAGETSLPASRTELNSILKDDLRLNFLKLFSTVEKLPEEQLRAQTAVLLKTILEFLENGRDNFFNPRTTPSTEGSVLLPVHFAEDFQGFLRLVQFESEVEKKDPRKGKRKGFRLLMLLNTTALKTVLADFLLVADFLTIRFYLENWMIQAFFSAHLSELEELVGQYYQNLKIEALVAPEKKQELFSEIFLPTERRLVDLKA